MKFAGAAVDRRKELAENDHPRDRGPNDKGPKVLLVERRFALEGPFPAVSHRLRLTAIYGIARRLGSMGYLSRRIMRRGVERAARVSVGKPRSPPQHLPGRPDGVACCDHVVDEEDG